jgi:hypothetical protein
MNDHRVTVLMRPNSTRCGIRIDSCITLDASSCGLTTATLVAFVVPHWRQSMSCMEMGFDRSVDGVCGLLFAGLSTQAAPYQDRVARLVTSTYS